MNRTLREEDPISTASGGPYGRSGRCWCPATCHADADVSSGYGATEPGVRGWLSGRRAFLPAGPGAPLALVHGRDPGDRDGVALGDKVGGQTLRRGQRFRPRVAPGEQVRRVPQGEI